MLHKRAREDCHADQSYIDLLPREIRELTAELLMSSVMSERKEIADTMVHIAFRQAKLTGEMLSVQNHATDARQVECDLHQELGYCHPLSTSHRQHVMMIDEYKKILQHNLDLLRANCIALEAKEAKLVGSLAWRSEITYANHALHCY